MKNGWNTEKTRTMILCAFLGIFGAHKFYQKKKKEGIAFIILDLTIIGMLITTIWAFIDLLILTIDKKNSDKELILGLILITLTISFRLYIQRVKIYRNIPSIDETTILQKENITD